MSSPSLNYTYLYFDVLDYTNSSVLTSYTLGNTPLKFVPDFTTSNILSGANNISNKTIRWEFGDGTFSTDLSPSHNYQWPGEYRVSLTVYDGSGNAYDSTFSTTVQIYDFIANQISFKDYKSFIYDIPVGKLIDPLTVNAYFSWQSYNALSATGYTINLYASGAKGAYNYVEKTQNDKWSHLRSLSRFYALSTINSYTDYVTIESIQPVINEIYVNIQNNQLQICQSTDSGSIFAGVTGSCQFWYTDDIPANLLTESSPIIIFASVDNAKFNDAFTQRVNAYDVINYPPYGYQNINPAVFANVKTRYNPADHLSITTTGIDGEGTPVDHAFDIPYASWQNTEIPYVIKFKDDQDFTTKNYPPLSSSSTINSSIYNNPQPYYDIQTGVIYNNGENNVPVEGVTFYEDFALGAPQTIGAFYKGYFIPTQSTENCFLTASVNIIDPPYFRKDAVVNWIAVPQYYSAIRIFREEIINGYTNNTTVTFPVNTFNIAENNTYAITVAPSGATADSDYRTWFADSVSDQLLQYDINGNLLTTYNLSAMPTLINNQITTIDYRYRSTTANELTAASPNDIVLDGKNNLWVSLFDSGNVIKIDSSTGYVITVAAPFDTATTITSSDYNKLLFNPLAYYTLDGDINDISGNGYNLLGNYNPGPSLGSRTQTFDGTTNQTLSYNNDLWDIYTSPQDYSVSFWFNPQIPINQFSLPINFPLIVSGKMGIEIYNANGNFGPGPIAARIPGSGIDIKSNTSLVNNEWYYISVVHDSKQRQLSLYINSILESTAVYTTLDPSFYNITGFSINGFSSLGRYVPGYYSSLLLTNNVLSPSQILYLFEESVNSYTLKGFANEVFCLPSSIDTDINNNLWVAYTHPEYSTLIQYRGENNFKISADILQTITFPSGISPEQIQIDRNNNVWVTAINHNSQGIGFSNRNDYLYKFDINGNLLPGYPLSGFQQIGNLTIDGNQNAWVIQGAETLTKVDGILGTTSNYVAGQGKNTTEYICSVGGITCDTTNDIWLINNFDNNLYVFNADSSSTGTLNPKYTIPLTYPNTSLPPVTAYTSTLISCTTALNLSAYITTNNEIINGGNLLTYSANIGVPGTNWSFAGPSSMIVTPEYDIAPDGTKTATRIQVVDLATNILAQTFPTVAGTTYTMSFYAKANSGTPYIQYRLWGGSTYEIFATGVTQIDTTTWTRVSLTFTAAETHNATDVTPYWARIVNESPVADFLVWGAQVEPVATAGTYISTTDTRLLQIQSNTFPAGAYSDGLQEFQAYGDWNGFNWLNKYAAPVSTVRTITGSSNLFNIYPDQGQFNIAKINEDWNASGYYDSLRFQETLLDKQVFFDQFLGVILGGLNAQPYELGKTVYEKIANFVDNNVDIDKVNLDELLSFCNELSVDYDQFNIIFPPQIRRLVDLLSIKQSKLWGSLNVYGLNFDPRGTSFPNNTYGINLSSVIDPLTGTFYNGIPIVAKETFSGNYKIVNTNLIDNKYATYNNNEYVTVYNTLTTGYIITVTGAGDVNSNGTYFSNSLSDSFINFENTDPNSNYYITFTKENPLFGLPDLWSIVESDIGNIYTLTSAFSAIYQPNNNWIATDPAYLPTPSTTFTTSTSTYQVSSYTVAATPSIPLSSYTPDWGWGLVAPNIVGPTINNYYTFYTYNPVHSNTYYDNIINWNDPYTTLQPTNSAYTDWSQDNGIIQSLFSYELTKGFRLFTSAANITYNN